MPTSQGIQCVGIDFPRSEGSSCPAFTYANVMDIERAVDEFVSRGENLFHHLRSEGESLSALGLRVLRIQLHILNVEAARLEHIKQFGPRPVNDSPTKSTAKEKSPNKCEHHRLFDDGIEARDEQTGLVYCLECGRIIKDPFSEPE